MGSNLDRSKVSLVWLVLLQTLFCSPGFAGDGIFKFHLKNEPSVIDPSLSTSGETTYLLSNLYRGLTRFNQDGQLIFDLAEKCYQKTFSLVTCRIRKDAKWSDGTAVMARDFIDSFLRIIQPGSKSYIAPLLFGIRNAKLIYEGKARSGDFGMTAVSEKEVKFELSDPDTEFLEKLSNPLLVAFRPLKSGQDKSLLVVTGPYKIKQMIKGQKAILEPNYFYPGKNPRPHVEIYYAGEDSTALNLYEKGIINFLWRLTADHIPKYRDNPDFFRKYTARFDYLGFNMRPGSVFENKATRQAFARSPRYDEYAKLVSGFPPGCPGLGDTFLANDGHCIQIEASPGTLGLTKPVRFFYSQLGGDDIARQATWFQEQWHKYLGVKVEIKGLEQKVYLSTLKTNPPDMFRKGIGLNRPSCQAALESFTTDHPENFVGFHNVRFDKLVKALSSQKMSRSERESICGVASDILFKEEYVGIPMGRIDFAMLASREFRGWQINDLNQLDLSQLEYVGAK